MAPELTPDQQSALNNILAWLRTPINDRSDVAGILYAAAGCGKTFLTRVICNKVRGSYRIAGVAPTHKARKVLDGFLNKNSMMKVKTMTIASLLNKMRGHSYIGTKHYVRGADSKMHLYDLFLIDEASMITDNDVQLVISYAFEFKRKVLFIGDKCQIPNPSQKFICQGDFATKRDSLAFELPHQFQLTTNVRQTEDNPIVTLYGEFRDAITERREPEIKRRSKIEEDRGVKFYKKRDKWYLAIQDKFLTTDPAQMHTIRILAYTNDTVKNHNLMIRRIFNRGPDPEVGELLMGYNNLGWPEKIIENSQDYYVTSVTPTTTHTVSAGKRFQNLVGNILTIKETDTNVSSVIFIPELNAPENQPMLEELVIRAEKVNRRGSTKDDFKKYCQLKNKLVFMENVYKFQGEILGEGEFRTNNPLLFKPVSDMIEDQDDGDREVLDNKMSRDVTERYGSILEDRVEDDKALAGSEKLCDRYCVIEKDLDYGNCITAHKSQGSNFTTVFVDEADFDKLFDYWNYDIGCKIDASKERNQLKYVCYTRPTHSAHVFYRK